MESNSVILGMPAKDYHAAPAMSNSALSRLNVSPFHYWAEYLNPARPEREASASMQAGTLAHALILEPEKVESLYVVKPADCDMRTKAGKEWAAAQTRTIVTAEQMATAKEQRAAVLALPDVADILRKGSAEVSFFWTDSETGIKCKARADFSHPLPDGRVILLDLKTTTDAAPDPFGRSAWTYGYHRQAAFYTRGYEMAAGVEVAAFVFAVVSSAYPFAAVAYTLDDQAMWQGQQECDELLAKYADCRAKNNWPAYGEGVQLLSLPRWAQRDMESEVAYV